MQQRSPVYGNKKFDTVQRSESLQDILRESTLHDEVASEDSIPILQELEASPIAKFNRAVKRLKIARALGNATPSKSKADGIISYFRIKKMISKPGLRQDIALLSPVERVDDAAWLLKRKFAPLSALSINSPGMIIWNLIQVVLFMYIIIYVPYRVSFADIGLDDDDCRKDSVFEGIDLFVDTFYLIDLVVFACTQTVNSQGVLLSHLKDTVPHYVLSWTFLRDLAPAIPMAWIEYSQGPADCSTVSTTSSAGLTKLLRILRIFRILRVFKLFNVKVFNDILRHMDPNVKTLAGLFAALMVLVHLLACLWFFVKKDSSDVSDWYSEHGLATGSNRPLRIYLSCIYFIVATLATVGYGDIHASQENERALAIGIMLLGTVVFALIISTASMIVQNSNVDDVAHGTKIAMVHQFCSSWKLGEPLKYDMLDFFLSSKDIFLENSNTKSVMNALPPEYQYLVAPHVANECLAKTALFKGCAPEFMSLLLECLQLESFTSGEVLFRSGDIPHSIYIIKSGTCLIINDCNMVVAELSDADIFGEVSCFLSSPRPCTCVCSKFCELYVLHVRGLAKIFKMFPDFRLSFSVYVRRKILVDVSTKLQLSSICHSAPRHDAPPFASPPQSPSLGAQRPSIDFSDTSAKRPLKPLPKGRYKPPIVPDLAQIMLSRTTQASHAERIRLFAEIQV